MSVARCESGALRQLSLWSHARRAPAHTPYTAHCLMMRRRLHCVTHTVQSPRCTATAVKPPHQAGPERLAWQQGLLTRGAIFCQTLCERYAVGACCNRMLPSKEQLSSALDEHATQRACHTHIRVVARHARPPPYALQQRNLRVVQLPCGHGSSAGKREHAWSMHVHPILWGLRPSGPCMRLSVNMSSGGPEAATVVRDERVGATSVRQGVRPGCGCGCGTWIVAPGAPAAFARPVPCRSSALLSGSANHVLTALVGIVIHCIRPAQQNTVSDLGRASVAWVLLSDHSHAYCRPLCVIHRS